MLCCVSRSAASYLAGFIIDGECLTLPNGLAGIIRLGPAPAVLQALVLCAQRGGLLIVLRSYKDRAMRKKKSVNGSAATASMNFNDALKGLSDQLRDIIRQIQDVGEFMTANKLACGVGGRLSEEDKHFLRLVANLDPEEAEILEAHEEFVERMARE